MFSSFKFLLIDWIEFTPYRQHFSHVTASLQFLNDKVKI